MARPNCILLGASQAIFSFSKTHANLLFETFACTERGREGEEGRERAGEWRVCIACGMTTVVGVAAGTPTVTITFPAAPLTSVCVLQMRKLHSKRKTQRLTYKIAVQDSVRGGEVSHSGLGSRKEGVAEGRAGIQITKMLLGAGGANHMPKSV